MAIIQGTENIEVHIVSRALEQEWVSQAQQQAISKLNAEGKRVINIEKTKRASGLGEFSQYHVNVTLLWEADEDNPDYKAWKNAVDREKEKQERARREKEREKWEKALEKRKEEEEAKKKIILAEEEQIACGYEKFWEIHSKERALLLDERKWLSETSGGYGYRDVVKKRIQVIDNILNKKVREEGFSELEEMQIQIGSLVALQITDAEAYRRCIEKIPELKVIENVQEIENVHWGVFSIVTILSLIAIITGISFFHYDEFVWGLICVLIGLGVLAYYTSVTGKKAIKSSKQKFACRKIVKKVKKLRKAGEL